MSICWKLVKAQISCNINEIGKKKKMSLKKVLNNVKKVFNTVSKHYSVFNIL